MVTLQTQKVFYHYVRQEPLFYEVVKPRFFENIDIQECYSNDIEFYSKYKKIPTKEQLKNILIEKQSKTFTEKSEHTNDIEFNNDKLTAIFDIVLDEYEQTWLKESFEAWVQWKNLDFSMFDSISYMKSKQITVENIKDVVATVKEMILKQNNLSFNFDPGLDFFNAESHYQNEYVKFNSGYSWMNKMLGGGFAEKTLITFIGRMKIGKSIWLSNLAINGIRNGYNVAVITLEMGDKDFLKRIGSNMFNVQMSDYETWSRNTEKVKSELKRIKTMDEETMMIPGELYIKEYPTSAAGVPEIEAWLTKMEELKRIKFKLVVLDYINILKNWRNPNTENTYMKIKQIAEDLRAMAIRNNWCIITASQIGKQGFKSNDIDMSDVSESVGLVATVDAMFGIIQDISDKANNQYQLKAIALRNAQGIGERKIYNIDYNYMRITEDSTDSKIDIEEFLM